MRRKEVRKRARVISERKKNPGPGVCGREKKKQAGARSGGCLMCGGCEITGSCVLES